ncbi:hypothetical protein [Natronohydrobacter thiooxidans]|uniref:hypothetical protein n=1 Tax=Natronohydrobacter thiooxidans TaxID=87172 RepID=UPI0008FF4EB1|nr:hypothetical protein [Natronohydrobacter thiooxidans]
MTFHFAHMAPPGASARRTPVACWLRDARTGRLVQHWLTATPTQPDALDTPLCALLAQQARLRAG